MLTGKINTLSYNEIIFVEDLVKICHVGNILKKEKFLMQHDWNALGNSEIVSSLKRTEIMWTTRMWDRKEENKA